MVCKKCGSENVKVENETTTKTKHRGCIGWAIWILLACCTLGLIIIIPLLTNNKTKTKHKTVAICQDCGHRWYV
jgi:ssDNA-binding Zn-finger/Zn-ribbon topoisomerase 1